jgi:hypothetical protein
VRAAVAACLLGAGVGLALACGGLPLYETPEERRESGGLPLERTEQPRTGSLTWRLEAIEQTPDGPRLDFVLVNGTKRDYLSLMLRLVLRGPGHALATLRYPVGGIRADGSRRVRAHLAPPGFPVEDVELELIYAQE